jgi:hypothetical protein
VDCPGFNVNGTARPVALNKDPATEMEEMAKGAFPADVSVTVLVAVCPTATDPNETVVLLIVRAGAATFS